MDTQLVAALAGGLAAGALAVGLAAPASADPLDCQPKNCQVLCLKERNVSQQAWNECIKRCMSTGGGTGTTE